MKWRFRRAWSVTVILGLNERSMGPNLNLSSSIMHLRKGNYFLLLMRDLGNLLDSEKCLLYNKWLTLDHSQVCWRMAYKQKLTITNDSFSPGSVCESL